MLDDDGDMAEMYLTDKLMQQLENASETSSVDEQEDVDEHVLQSEAVDRFASSVYSIPSTFSFLFYSELGITVISSCIILEFLWKLMRA